jgi:hypothetical protein
MLGAYLVPLRGHQRRARIEEWHAVIGAPTLDDAILDRLLNNVYKINLRRGFMSKRKELVENPRKNR